MINTRNEHHCHHHHKKFYEIKKKSEKKIALPLYIYKLDQPQEHPDQVVLYALYPPQKLPYIFKILQLKTSKFIQINCKAFSFRIDKTEKNIEEEQRKEREWFCY